MLPRSPTSAKVARFFGEMPDGEAFASPTITPSMRQEQASVKVTGRTGSNLFGGKEMTAASFTSTIATSSAATATTGTLLSQRWTVPKLLGDRCITTDSDCDQVHIISRSNSVPSPTQQQPSSSGDDDEEHPLGCDQDDSDDEDQDFEMPIASPSTIDRRRNASPILTLSSPSSMSSSSTSLKSPTLTMTSAWSPNSFLSSPAASHSTGITTPSRSPRSRNSSSHPYASPSLVEMLQQSPPASIITTSRLAQREVDAFDYQQFPCRRIDKCDTSILDETLYKDDAVSNAKRTSGFRRHRKGSWKGRRMLLTRNYHETVAHRKVQPHACLHCFESSESTSFEVERLLLNGDSFAAVVESTKHLTGSEKHSWIIRVKGIAINNKVLAREGRSEGWRRDNTQEWLLRFDRLDRFQIWLKELKHIIHTLREMEDVFRKGHRNSITEASKYESLVAAKASDAAQRRNASQSSTHGIFGDFIEEMSSSTDSLALVPPIVASQRREQRWRSDTITHYHGDAFDGGSQQPPRDNLLSVNRQGRQRQHLAPDEAGALLSSNQPVFLTYHPSKSSISIVSEAKSATDGDTGKLTAILSKPRSRNPGLRLESQSLRSYEFLNDINMSEDLPLDSPTDPDSSIFSSRCSSRYSQESVNRSSDLPTTPLIEGSSPLLSAKTDSLQPSEQDILIGLAI